MDFIQKNAPFFARYCGDHPDGVNGYLSKMRKNKEYGDELFCVAFAARYKRHLIIYTEYRTGGSGSETHLWPSKGTATSIAPVRISLNMSAQHYEMVVPVNDFAEGSTLNLGDDSGVDDDLDDDEFGPPDSGNPNSGPQSSERGHKKPPPPPPRKERREDRTDPVHAHLNGVFTKLKNGGFDAQLKAGQFWHHPPPPDFAFRNAIEKGKKSEATTDETVIKSAISSYYHRSCFFWVPHVTWPEIPFVSSLF